MAKTSLTNEVIDLMIGKCPLRGWVRDIPFSFIARELPGVTPARESQKGRGAPVFDVYHPGKVNGAFRGDEMAISIKVSREDRLPRACSLTVGREEHIECLLTAIRNGLSIPVLVFNWNPKTGEWHQLSFDAGEVLREFPPVPSNGKRGNVSTFRIARRKSGKDEFGRDKFIEYTDIRINFKPMIGEGFGNWKEIAEPALPHNF